MTQRIPRLLRPILALIPGGILVVFCYFFVDRQVAWFAHDLRRSSPNAFVTLLNWLPQVSEWFGYLVALGIVAVVAWRLWRPGSQFQTLISAIAANLVATFLIKIVLKWAFGRTWPESWIKNNPSLIANQVYGFYPFHGGSAYESFPSGHAAATFAVISILWISRPRWRWQCTIVGAFVCAALVGLNYHFVGDVIAGALLGSLTGVYATHLCRLRPVHDKQEPED